MNIYLSIHSFVRDKVQDKNKQDRSGRLLK